MCSDTPVGTVCYHGCGQVNIIKTSGSEPTMTHYDSSMGWK